MKTKAKYEIELAVSKNECREVITNVQLDKKNNCLIATNGRILAIVPVETDIDDISGPISPKAFKIARKGVSKKEREDKVKQKKVGKILHVSPHIIIPDRESSLM